MTNKIKYIYLAFFISLLIILSSLNFVYKKFITNLQVGYNYKISAIQINDFKSLSLEYLLDSIYNEKRRQTYNKAGEPNYDKPYIIENLIVQKSVDSMLDFLEYRIATTVDFSLVSERYFDEKDLEKKLNDAYHNSINEVYFEIKDNIYLLDYENVTSEYYQTIKLNINTAHDEIVNSNFYKKYPINVCKSDNKEECLMRYSKYYQLIYDQILGDDPSEGIINLLGSENDYSNSEVFQDFISNKELFSSAHIQQMQDFNTNRSNIDLKNFLSDKYKEILKTDFYNKYLLLSRLKYPSCIREKDLMNKDCLDQLSTYYFRIMHDLNSERTKNFSISYSKPPERKGQILSDTLMITGLTLGLTYIFFNLTNKFFRRKIK